MSKNLFIAAAEAETGKSLIALGIMELLSRHIGKVGFFRPIVRSKEQEDHHIKLISRRYNLAFRYDDMYGLSSDEALEYIQAGDMDRLYTEILKKYKKLESKCDFVLCEGTDFRGSLSPFEFDLNARIANNLGTPVLGIISGHGKTVNQIMDTVQIVKNALVREKSSFAGIIVNRAQEEEIEAIQKQLKKMKPGTDMNFVIPEKLILQKLTMRQVMDALNAELVYGNDETLNNHIYDFKVAAMSLERILVHTSSGSLVITPGDRTDVLLTLFMTLISRNYEHIAGILLTGGVKPDPYFMKLINGIDQMPVPIISTYTDTYTTAMRVNKIRPLIAPQNERRIATALGHFESYVDGEKLAQKIQLSKSNLVSPIMFEYELFERARANRKHIVLPEASDERILKAADILHRRNVVDLTLLGNEEEILQKTASFQISLDGVNIVDPANSELRNQYAEEYYKLRKHKGVTLSGAFDIMGDVSYFGTMMVHLGHADGMVSGAAHTTQHTIRPAFEFIKTKPGVSIVSSSFLMSFEDRVLVYGDCAVNPNPNSEQLADIAISSAETAMMFGIEPRIAMLSYSTGESGKGEDVEKVRKATAIVRERRPELSVEGPIQYDAAIDAGVAAKKMPGSTVAGRATVFIFPDLNTGNNTYKAVQRSSGAIAIGPVLQGLNKPVNDLSRGCLVKDIVNTVVITAIQAQAGS